MTSMIETTRRAMYHCLDRMRRAGKHRKLTAEFEERLEEHLEELKSANQALALYLGEQKERIQELTELVGSQRKAYASLHQLKFGISPEQDAANVLKTKCEALAIFRNDGQSNLEALNRTLVAQVEELTRELDLLKLANEIAGDELRQSRRMKIEDRVAEIHNGEGQVLYFPFP
ncbi:MAG: hypothetical protein RR740_08995 [Pseudomonas sp.]